MPSCNVVKICLLFVNRYISQGGEAALQDNEERLRAVEDRERQINRKKHGITEIIDSYKEDISKQEVSRFVFLFIQLGTCQALLDDYMCVGFD